MRAYEGPPPTARRPKIKARPKPKQSVATTRHAVQGDTAGTASLHAGAKAAAPMIRREQRKATTRHATQGDVAGTASLHAGAKAAAGVIKAERIKYLRRTRKGGFGITIRPAHVAAAVLSQAKKELEGRGALAHGLTKLGNYSAGVATKNDAVSKLGLFPGSNEVGQAAKDIVQAPAQVVPSVYVPAAGLYEAAKGRPQRIKQFGKDFAATDPFYALATGHPGKALKRAEAHPGFTLLEAYGVKGALGRGAGATMRSGALGKAAKGAASVQREAATVPGTAIVKPRQYSRDVFRRAEQVNRENRLKREAAKLRERAAAVEATDKPNAAAEAEALRAKARRVDPLMVSSHELKRQVAETVAANEDIRRANRPVVAREVRAALKPMQGKVGKGAVSLVAQNIAHASKADLRAYLQSIKAEYPNLDRAGKYANRQLQRALQRAIDHGDMSAVQEAVTRYHDVIAPRQKLLQDRGLLQPEQATRAEVIPYAIRRMNAENTVDAWRGGKPFKQSVKARTDKYPAYVAAKQALLTAREDYKVARNEGGDVQAASKKLDAAKAKVTELQPQAYRPLPTEEILAHMKANGVSPATFITQAPRTNTARSFNIRSERAQAIGAGRRTGQATRHGTFSVHPDVLVENAQRIQGLVDATDGFRRIVKEFAVRGKSGKVKTFGSRNQAMKAAGNLGLPGEQQYRAIRLTPFMSPDAQLSNLLDEVNSQSQLLGHKGGHSPLIQAQLDALEGKGSGPWGLVPEEVASELQQHLRSMGQGALGKSGQLVNQAFRQTVLATSPSWAAGNVIEAAFRSALAKAGPGSYRAGRMLLKAGDQAGVGQELRARTVGGGYAAFADRTVYRSAEQFTGTALEGLAQNLGKFWRTPGPKYVAAAWHVWTHYVFQSMRLVEQQFQTALLGRAAREQGILPQHVLSLSQKAVNEAVAGKLNTPAQRELGRAVDRAYGRYNKWSPGERALIANYTPFLAWSRNAAIFIGDVLPRDHPVALAVIAASERATDDWRKQHGLDFYAPGAVPMWLQGSIPTAGGGHQRAPTRYLPFGAATNPLDTGASLVLPQFWSTLMAARGMDWTGKPLKSKDPTHATDAAKAFLQSTVPILSTARNISNKGLRALNPLAPVAPKKAKSGSSSLANEFQDFVKSQGSSGTGKEFQDYVKKSGSSSSVGSEFDQYLKGGG